MTATDSSEGSSPASTTAPIFLVGCQRSGTTVLRLMLDSHPNISCGPETRFLKDLETITGSQWYRIQRFGFPREYWLTKAADYFGTFQADYAHERGKSRWADKSPLYSLILDYIWELFPDAQVIHIIRDVRDVTASHRRAFGYKSALRAPLKWEHYINEVRRAARQVPANQYREIRYEELTREREATMRQILDFLGETWDPSVLDYEATKHDVSEYYWRESQQRRSGFTRSRKLDPVLQITTKVLARRTRRELDY